MNGHMYKRVVQISLGLMMGASFAPVLAANPAAPSDINMNELAILEHRYFSHAYGHDPAEKRLERIECLVFGSTREGSNTERMSRLMKAVASRAQQPIAQDKSAPPAAAAEPAPVAGKTPATSKQYPVLNTLEWRAFKKTYISESLDQRLDRLESKLFGQPAQTMAYADRVDRIQKTLGIGINTEMNDGITATGPMPKARPRGEEIDGFNNGMQMPLEGYGLPRQMPFGSISPLGGMNPFGGINPFGSDTQVGPLNTLNQMMQDMNKQMANLRNLGPGTWVLDPKTGDFVEQNTQRRVSPNSKPSGTTPGGMPLLPNAQQGQNPVIPGYADPNSI